MKFFLGLCLLLAACAPSTATPLDSERKAETFPSPTASGAEARTHTAGSNGAGAETAQPLTVTVTPDIEQSFKQVVGRAPFTVTFGVTVAGGAPPYQFAWDFDATGRVESTAQAPPRQVFPKPGEYETVVVVKDSTGASARGTRRIVVLGGPPPVPTFRFGVTAHLERRRAGYYPTLADVTRAVELMQAAGVQAVRIDFNWDLLNPTQGQWNLQDYDGMVQIVQAHKVDILGIVDYMSWWASSAQDSDDWRVRLYSEPLHNIDFAHYTFELVSHFRQSVHAWEIWNEPNTVGFWKPKPDAAHYTLLLQEAYLAAKYADPNAVVVFGGTSGNGIDGDDKSGLASNFIADAYTAGARGFFDVMAIHPYMLPNSGIAIVRNKVAATRAVLAAHGDGNLPLWITEVGAPSDVPWWPTAPVQSEGDVAAWLGQVYTHLADLTPAIFWYDFQDQGIGDPVEQKFGLLHVDFSPKPAYEEYRMLANR